jgi:hypothetical protein
MDASGMIRYARAGLLGVEEGKTLFLALLAEASEAKALHESRRRRP